MTCVVMICPGCGRWNKYVDRRRKKVLVKGVLCDPCLNVKAEFDAYERCQAEKLKKASEELAK